MGGSRLLYRLWHIEKGIAMKKCKNCGNEMRDDSLYCAKCGTFAGEETQRNGGTAASGETQGNGGTAAVRETQEKSGAVAVRETQGNGGKFVGGETPKKNGRELPRYFKIAFAAVAMVGVVCILLYGAGIFGGKGTTEETAENGAQTGEEQGLGIKEKLFGAKQDDIAEKAWTAYQAYCEAAYQANEGFSEYISALEEYEASEEEDDEDSEESEPPKWEDYDKYDFPIEQLYGYWDGYDSETYHSRHLYGKLLYLDSDDYPEMLIICGSDSLILTYRNGKVICHADKDEDENIGRNDFFKKDVAIELSFKERQNLWRITYVNNQASEIIISEVKEVICKIDVEQGSSKIVWCGSREFGDWGDDDSDRKFHYKKKYRIYHAEDIESMESDRKDETSVLGQNSGDVLRSMESDNEDDTSVQRKEVSEEEYQKQLMQQVGDQSDWKDFIPSYDAEGDAPMWFEFANRYKSTVPRLLDLPSEKSNEETYVLDGVFFNKE